METEESAESKHEIITIQIGNFSNHVGSFFWNAVSKTEFNSELKPSTLLHQGSSIIAPRTLIIDQKGAYTGTYELSDQLGLQQGIAPTNVSMNLETNPKDPFSKHSSFRFDRKTIHELPPSEYTQPQISDNYADGKGIFHKEEEEIMDKYRLLLEDCDQLQGTQCFIDVDSCFGGLGESILTYIADDFTKKPILTFGLNSTMSNSENVLVKYRHATNKLQSLYKLSTFSSLYVPVKSPTYWDLKKMPYLFIDLQNISLSSAVVASMIETCTLPLRSNSNGLSSLIGCLTMSSRMNIVTLSAALPFPLSNSISFEDSANRQGELFKNPIMYNFSKGSYDEKLSTPYAESVVLRGVSEPSIQTVTSYLDRYLSVVSCRRISSVFTKPFELSHPFPALFTDVGKDGEIISKERASTSQRYLNPAVQRAPILTHLQNTKSVRNIIYDAQEEFSSIFNFSGDSSDNIEEYKEMKNELQSMIDNYY